MVREKHGFKKSKKEIKLHHQGGPKMKFGTKTLKYQNTSLKIVKFNLGIGY